MPESEVRVNENQTGAAPAENISGQDYERIKHLTELLNRASEAYYNKDTEIMSNLEYDRLYDELSALEEKHRDRPCGLAHRARRVYGRRGPPQGAARKSHAVPG